MSFLVENPLALPSLAEFVEKTGHAVKIDRAGAAESAPNPLNPEFHTIDEVNCLPQIISISSPSIFSFFVHLCNALVSTDQRLISAPLQELESSQGGAQGIGTLLSTPLKGNPLESFFTPLARVFPNFFSSKKKASVRTIAEEEDVVRSISKALDEACPDEAFRV